MDGIDSTLDFPPLGHSLEVRVGEDLVFASNDRWLRPLVELERFLLDKPLLDRGSLLVRDRIVGRAAALLLVRLGVQRVEAGLLSRPGQEALEAAGVRYRCRELVDRIGCRTESLLLTETDPELAYRLVCALLAESSGADA